MFSTQRPFIGQKPDEKVILFVRKYWISFLGFVGLTLGMTLVLVVFLIILAFLSPDFFIAFRSHLILISSAYFLFVLAFFLVGWIDYYFDVVIVTDRRIIDIHQRGLFSREIDELDILHVEDVSARTKGILPTIFRYGNVYVQTAGAARNFLFESVPYPQKMCRQILALYDEILSKQPERLKNLDRAEGLGPRHIHSSSNEITGPDDSMPQSSLQSSQPDEETDRPEEKHNLDGEISEGEEVNFRDHPPKN